MKVSREDLWNKKLSNKLNGASFVIALHDKFNLSEKINILLSYKEINLFFKLKHITYIAYPDIAVTMQKIQQKLKTFKKK
jgi:hypothetical protein